MESNFFDPAHLFNFFALLAYILIKELILDRKDLSEKLREAQNKKDPLKALELDLNSLKSKVVNLEDAVQQQGEGIDAKLDIILQDLKEKHTENRADLNEFRKDLAKVSERLAAVENEVRSKNRRR